jgi:hypothetical protein
LLQDCLDEAQFPLRQPVLSALGCTHGNRELNKLVVGKLLQPCFRPALQIGGNKGLNVNVCHFETSVFST